MSKTGAERVDADWRLKLAILLAPAPLSLCFAGVVAILPRMSAAMAHNAAQAYMVKMLVPTASLAITLGAPVAGDLADKLDRRRLLAWAGLAAAAAGAAPILLDDLGLILATRVALGLASILAYVIGAALVAKCLPAAARARWMGWYTAVAAGVGILGTLAAGFLGNLGWRWGFACYLAGLLVAAGAWLLPKGAGEAAEAEVAAAEAAQPGGARIPPALLVLALLVGVITYVPSIYIPFKLAAIGAATPSAISEALLVGLVLSTTGSAVFGPARRVLSSSAAFCCSFGLMALGLAIIAFAWDYPTVVAGLFVEGAGLGWLSPNVMATAAESVDEARRGRALGMARGAISLSPAFGVTAFEPLASRIGVEGVLVSNAALAAALLAVMAAGLAKARLGRPRSRLTLP
jgi:MFS family permease